MLYLTYDNVVDALRVFTGVPFGWVGGIFALWLRDMPFSISAAVGFIAMSGVAVLDDMIWCPTSGNCGRRGLPLDEAVDASGRHRLAARADDDAGGQPRLSADGVQHRHGGRSAAAAGDGRHRRRDRRDGDVAAVLRVLYVVFKSPVKSDPPEVAFVDTPQLVEVGAY